MRDLLTDPLWRPQDLGTPIPDTEFGVSVCLPLWQHVIGYEEKDPEVMRHFRSGYPRFCCPPAIGALFEAAEKEWAAPGERCLVFPREAHARRCLDFIEAQSGQRVGRAVVWSAQELGVAVFPAACHDLARRFWRFCGEVVSTRQACAALAPASASVSASEGREATRVLRERLARISGQTPEDVFLFPSGMAANYAVHRMLTRLRPGLRTAQLDFPYVDVLKLQEVFGAGVHFLPWQEENAFAETWRALAGSTALAGVFAEAPSNPLLRCVNLPLVRETLDSLQPQTPLIVDDTIATVAHVDAFRVADAVTTSLTKSFSGTGDVLAGSVILNRRSRFYAEFAAFMRDSAEHDLWHADAVALELNSRDFEQRVAQMSDGASRMAEWLAGHPRVQKVWHAATEGGSGFESIRRPDGGYGCLLSFVLKEPATRSARMFDRLEVCKGPSLGTNFTLACPYTMLAHYDELDWAESCGVDRHLIRVSIGLETPEDLIGRFSRALES